MDFHLGWQTEMRTAKGLSTSKDWHLDFRLEILTDFETEMQMGLDLSTPMAKHLGCRSGMPRGWHSETVRCLWTERLKANQRERQMDS